MSETAKKLDKQLKRALPVVMVILIGYLYVVLFTSLSHPGIVVLEFGLLGFFALELGVKYHLAATWREFLRNHWLKIVLLLPFLRVLRMFSALGLVSRSLLSSLRVLPYAQKLAKLPTLLAKLKPLALAGLGYLSVRDRRNEEGDDSS